MQRIWWIVFRVFLVREAHLSADRLSSTPKCPSTPKRPYSSYTDYASDLLDASHRSISGTLSGSYELYDAEVSGLTSHHRPQSPASVISDVGEFDPQRIRPIQSRDIKAKLKRRHTTRRWQCSRTLDDVAYLWYSLLVPKTCNSSFHTFIFWFNHISLKTLWFEGGQFCIPDGKVSFMFKHWIYINS